MSIAALVAVALTALGAATPARAATVSVTGSTLVVAAGPGEVNHVQIVPDFGRVAVLDDVPPTPGSGCALAAPGRVTCMLWVARASVDLGDGDDSLAVTAGLPASVTDGAGDDVVAGGRRDDTFAASPGADRYAGGAGQDLITYAARTQPVVVRVDAPGGDGAAGEGDEVAGDVERVTGGDGADRLTGDAGPEQLRGGAGDDSLDGGAGADLLDGGTGFDTVDYSARAAAVVVDLDGIADDGEDGERDNARTTNERVLGGAGADRIAGTAGPQALAGGPGADELRGGDGDDVLDGGAGADGLWGEAGIDTADYSMRAAALTVDLDDQADDGESGEGDDVHSDVENVAGGSGPDALGGASGVNVLAGGAGDDRIAGGAGADLLDGGDGADVLDARDGEDDALRCGGGRDEADADGADRAEACETVRTATTPATRLPGLGTFDPPAARLVLRGVRRRVGGGRFVPIPGYDGERIDRRIVADIAYLRRRFGVAVTAGLAMHGHAREREHPIGLAVDLVPRPGGSWKSVDRLARWAEPRAGRPRSPFRRVLYEGDAGYGRGKHLHLSWRHSRARAGHPARVAWTLDLRRARRR